MNPAHSWTEVNDVTDMLIGALYELQAADPASFLSRCENIGIDTQKLKELGFDSLDETVSPQESD